MLRSPLDLLFPAPIKPRMEGSNIIGHYSRSQINGDWIEKKSLLSSMIEFYSNQQPMSSIYEPKDTGIGSLAPIALKNPKAWIPKTLSGEDNITDGYLVFDGFSRNNFYSFSVVSMLGYSSYLIRTKATPTRYFKPIIYCAGLTGNTTITIQYKKTWETAYTTLDTININASNGERQIIRSTELLEVSGRPLVDILISNSNTGAIAKVLYVIDEASFYDCAIVCKSLGTSPDASWTFNPTFGTEKGFRVNKDTSNNHFRFPAWKPFGWNNGNTDSYPETTPTFNCAPTSLINSTNNRQSLSSFLGHQGYNGYNTKHIWGMFIIGNNIYKTRYVPYRGNGNYYGSSPASISPASASKTSRQYLQFFGRLDKIVTWCNIGGTTTYNSSTYNNNLDSITLKIGHYIDGTQTSSDPIGSGDTNWTTDFSGTVGFTVDPSILSTDIREGTKTVFNLSSIFASLPQSTVGYRIIIETVNSNPFSVPFLLDIYCDYIKDIPYPYSISSGYDETGNFDPNLFFPGYLKDVQTGYISTANPNEYMHTFTGGLGSYTIPPVSVLDTSDLKNYFRIKMDDITQPKFVTIRGGSTLTNFYGLVNSPLYGGTLGVSMPFNNTNYYDHDSRGDQTICLVKPNESVYGYVNQDTSMSFGFNIQEWTPHVKTLTIDTQTQITSQDLVGAGSATTTGFVHNECSLLCSLTGLTSGATYTLNILEDGQANQPLDVWATSDPTTYPLVIDDPNGLVKKWDSYSWPGGYYTQGDPASIPTSLVTAYRDSLLCYCSGSTTYDNGMWYILSYDKYTQSFSQAQWKKCLYSPIKDTFFSVNCLTPGGTQYKGVITPTGIQGDTTVTFSYPIIATSSNMRIMIRRPFPHMNKQTTYWAGNIFKVTVNS